jgi:hypothetical protein
VQRTGNICRNKPTKQHKRCSAPQHFRNEYSGALHLENTGIAKIPTNPDSYRDRSAAAGAGLFKGFTFSKGETFLCLFGNLKPFF